jgi:hypothetical protein
MFRLYYPIWIIAIAKMDNYPKGKRIARGMDGMYNEPKFLTT